MIQLLTTISNLPTLDLNEHEVSQLGDALQSLTPVTGEGLAQLLKAQARLSEKKQTQSVSYLTAYLQLGLRSDQYINQLIQQLKSAHHTQHINADELFPLLVELMPRNLNKLKLLRAQLELLCGFSQLLARSQDADVYKKQLYFFTQLLGAVTHKLTTLEPRRYSATVEEGQELSNHLAIQLRNEDRLQRRLHDLQTICDKYKAELFSDFMRELIAEENPLYLRYFTGPFNSEPVEERLSALFMAVQQRKEIFSDARREAANRLIAIDQLCTVLNKERSTAREKALAFKHKFDQHIELFENHTQRPKNFLQRILNFLFCFHLCPTRSKMNQSFLSKGSLFSALREKKQSAAHIPPSSTPWLHRQR